jgi:phosphoribosylglycinamide formyltransferase-1
MSKDLRVVMLVGRDESSNIMYHALEDEFDVVKVVVEAPVSRKKLLKSRIKRLGYIQVFGQVLFMLFNRFLFKFSSNRMQEIKKIHDLNDSPIDERKIVRVGSINDNRVIDLLKELDPDAVVVNGTRIISKKILDALEAPFINTHAGITPKYRGVHGGYWALANDDTAHCGVTIHLVDTGIDTGEVLYQENIEVTDKDSFNTYPLLQLAKALPLMRRALSDVEKGIVTPVKVDLPSKLWYHPTLWEYVGNYIKNGVR